MSGSGHIAGIVNPPAAGKYQYWTGDRGKQTFEQWKQTADETQGSWWPHWHNWIAQQDEGAVKARKPGGTKLKAIENAPGSYVSSTI